MADIRLPDGTLVRGVPDDITRADLMKKLSASGYDVSSLMPKPEPVKQDVPGVGETMLIAAGRGTDQIIKGAKQLYNRATGNDQANADLAAQVAEENQLYRPLQEARPYSTAIGEAAPNAAFLASGAGPVSLITRGALSGAVPEALKYGTDAERAGRGAIGATGGALGSGVGLAIGRALRPVAGGVAAATEATAAAQRLGFQPTPGQLLQNEALMVFENQLSKKPGSAGVMQAARESNQNALNRAGARSMGETSGDLSEPTFANAQSRIGQEYRRLEKTTAPQLDNDFLNALATVDAENLAKGPFKSGSVSSLVDKGLELASQNKLSGEAYKQIRTQLSNESQAAFKGGDAATGQAYKAVRDALDDAAGKSLSAADQEAWKTARDQWRAFKVLSKGNITEGGDVSAARVAAELRRGNNALRTGAAQGELADIARVGEAFKSVGNPYSGQLASDNMLGVPLAIGRNALSRVYLSPAGRAYVTNGLVPIGAGGRAGLSRLGAVGGSPALQNLLGVE